MADSENLSPEIAKKILDSTGSRTGQKKSIPFEGNVDKTPRPVLLATEKITPEDDAIMKRTEAWLATLAKKREEHATQAQSPPPPPEGFIKISLKILKYLFT